MSFRRMDESSVEHWSAIGAATLEAQPRVAEYALEMLRELKGITDAFAIDQYEHAIQTATRAERAGASDEMVVAALLHDAGKLLSVANHPKIIAEFLWPYVSDEVYNVIRVHQEFQGKHYYHHFGGDPNLRDAYRQEPWFDLARQFADEWDQTAFDPEYDSLPLSHFESRVRELFAVPKRM
jgi:predicted HD phosphohydrolase